MPDAMSACTLCGSHADAAPAQFDIPVGASQALISLPVCMPCDAVAGVPGTSAYWRLFAIATHAARELAAMPATTA